MKYSIKIYGDNIIECERMVDLIFSNVNIKTIKRELSSISCMKVDSTIEFNDETFELSLELYPGFNKQTSDRWNNNIFDILKPKGSFLNETPDVLLVKEENGFEKVLLGVEFCSALQAGNQAWQRSGRAYSTARSGIPYLYIVEFTKYELDNKRNRKALRFPNPAIPFSYLNYSIENGDLLAQVYFKGEEYQPTFDNKLKKFSSDIFGEQEVSKYIMNLILERDVSEYEKNIIDKNYQMVEDLSKSTLSSKAFDFTDWENIYRNKLDILDYANSKNKFKFNKKISSKASSDKIKKFQAIVNKYSIGIGSSDLPFGLIPKNSKKQFIKELKKIYPFNEENIDYNKHMIICMIKGFKPRGDDNRPDRGILPFIAMLVGEDCEILTYLYGPLYKQYYNHIIKDEILNLQTNGLWKSIVSLSNYILIESDILGTDNHLSILKDNTNNKKLMLERKNEEILMKISNVPNHLSENDVDSIIHILFKYIFENNSYEGMCNPPGGDWSGLSLIGEKEYRWLSLPRVSDNSKRPDHVIQLFNVLDESIILSIESKDKAGNLENEIGVQLKKYITDLTNYIPSVERIKYTKDWNISSSKAIISLKHLLSGIAYIKDRDISYSLLFDKHKCDVIFELIPQKENNNWIIKIITKSMHKQIFEKLLQQKKNEFENIIIELVII